MQCALQIGHSSLPPLIPHLHLAHSFLSSPLLHSLLVSLCYNLTHPHYHTLRTSLKHPHPHYYPHLPPTPSPSLPTPHPHSSHSLTPSLPPTSLHLSSLDGTCVIWDQRMTSLLWQSNARYSKNTRTLHQFVVSIRKCSFRFNYNVSLKWYLSLVNSIAITLHTSNLAWTDHHHLRSLYHTV